MSDSFPTAFEQSSQNNNNFEDRNFTELHQDRISILNSDSDQVLPSDVLNEISKSGDQLVEDKMVESRTQGAEVENVIERNELGRAKLDENIDTSGIADAILLDSISRNSGINGKPTEAEKFEDWFRLCEKHNFQPPIPLNEFNKLNFRYVHQVDPKTIKSGKFMPIEELSSIPRAIQKPLCHPGPEMGNWYLVDSTVQKVELKGAKQPYFVVRWVGYEDEYNTVEPLKNVKDSGVFELFQNSKTYTAYRSNNCAIARPELENAIKLDGSPALGALKAALEMERVAGRYSHAIGFFSITEALKHQMNRNRNRNHSSVHLDVHFVGPMYGNLSHAKIFKKAASKSVNLPSSLEKYINVGLRTAAQQKPQGPHYVAFFVARKHGIAEKVEKRHMSLHLCALIVRSIGGVKDAIFYDPSPKCYKHKLPAILQKLNVDSFTYQFGTICDKDDCVFRVMARLIGLAQDDTFFKVDSNECCKSIQQLKRNANQSPNKK